jgi:serine/threonine-protein kinase RsbW
VHTAVATARYSQIYRGHAIQVARVRRDLAAFLGSCPVADDVILVASELASNSILHSRSRAGFFTLTCEIYPGYCWIEVEDAGGPWRTRAPDPERPHGLAIVEALAGGPGEWGSEVTGAGDRVTWARPSW